VKKILVVCHGNVNRSPACAAILTKLRPDLEVRSAGLKVTAGRAAKKMREALRQYEFDLDDHKPQPVTPELLEWADAIIYMDGANKNKLSEGYGVPDSKLHCLARWSGTRRWTRVPDPAFMKAGSQEFEEVVDGIFDCSVAAAGSLR
jgi:protein-tyrosine-phosphatase